MDWEPSFVNRSTVASNPMQNSLFNESSNESERDPNLINLDVICLNENISDINDRCLQWLTHWESRTTVLSDVIASTDPAVTTIQTMDSTLFEHFFTSNATQISANQSLTPVYKWPFLFLGLLVFVGGFGNILVCLAIGFERRLQNATNYFLLRYATKTCSCLSPPLILCFGYSLAVADLLVSVVVMPFGILNEFYGQSIE